MELAEGLRADSAEDCNYGLTGEPCCFNEFAYKVVFDIGADSFPNTNGASFFCYHSGSCLKGFLIFDGFHLAAFNNNANLCDAEVFINGLNSLLNKLFGLEIDFIVGLDVNPFPKLLELLFLIYLFLEGRLFWATGILRLDC